MQPDLDRNRMRKESCRSEPGRHLACVAKQDRGELLSRNKINLKGVFDRDRFRLPIRLDRPVVTRVRQIDQRLSMRLSDHLR
jgi:hypothetical protein